MRLCLQFVLFSWATAWVLASPPGRPEQDADFLLGLLDHGEFDLAHEYAQRPSVGSGTEAKLAREYVLHRAAAELALADGDDVGFEAALKLSRPPLENLANRPVQFAFQYDLRPALGETLLRWGQRLAERAGSAPVGQRTKLMAEAKEKLEEAARAFAAAAANLTPPTPAIDPRATTDKKRLAQRRVDAYAACLIGQGLAVFEQSRLSGVSDQESGRKILEALAILDKAANLSDSIVYSARAQALVGRCNQGLDSRRSEEAYQKVLKDRRVDARLGQRDARAYRLLALAAAGQGGKAAERGRFITEVQTWLKDYAEWNRTSLALELRYELAGALLDEVAGYIEADRNKPEVVAKIQLAQQHLEAVVGAANSRRSVAEERLLASQLLVDMPAVSSNEVKGFAEASRRLRLSLILLGRLAEQQAAAKDEPTKQKKQAERRALLEEMPKLLARAETLKAAKLEGKAAEEWLKIQFDVLLRLQRWQEAAVVGEQLAGLTSRPGVAQKAAELTLQLYQALERQGDKAVRPKLAALAEKVAKQWPDSPAADLAREQIAQTFYEQQQFAQAAEWFGQVSARSPRQHWCGFQAGLAWWAQHVRQCQTQQVPFSNESEAKAKAFAQMEKCLPELDKATEPDAVRLALQYRFLLAEIYLRAGITERALATLGPLVQRVEKNELPADLPAGAAAKIISLALRAEVLKDPASPSALAKLTLLQRLGEKGELGGGVAERFQELGLELRNQISQLEKEGPAAAERLQVTRERFRQFLAQVEKLPQVPVELRLWMAGQYLLLDEPAKAAAIFAAIPKPSDEAPAAVVQAYRQSRLQWLVAVRAAVQAANETTRPQRLAELEAAMAKMQQEEEWCRRHPLFLKERILLLQLRGDLGGTDGAIAQWDKLRMALEPLADRGGMYREVYHDALLQLVVCLLEPSQLSAAEARASHEARALPLILLLRRGEASTELKARLEEVLGRADLADLKKRADELAPAGKDKP